MSLIYKICCAAEWQEAVAKGQFEGSAADRRDGFIHLSLANQLRETARRHFSGETDLVLAAFAEKDLAPSLKWEPSRGGDLFPHVYGTLPTQAARWVKPLPWRAGRHAFPPDIA